MSHSQQFLWEKEKKMRFTRNEKFTWCSTGDNENKWSAGQRNDCTEREKLGNCYENKSRRCTDDY